MTVRQTDANGWFEVKRNPLSRVGVFPYRGAQLGKDGTDADRVYRVYRPEEELANPDCMQSFKLIPWVDDHTMLGPGDLGLTPAEVKGVAGVVGEEIVYDSGVLYGNIKLFSDSMDRLIDAGKRELSCGYRCVYDWTPGIWNGQAYDCVQREIRGNHLALVNEGRMGPSVAVMDHHCFSFDAQEAIPMAGEKTEGTPDAGGAMTLEQISAILGQIGPQLAKLNEAMAAISGGKSATAAPAPAAADAPAAAPAPAAAAPVAPPAQPAAADATPAAMDAALKPIRDTLDGLGKTVAAMDAALKGMPAKFAQDGAEKAKLADRVANVVGTFDHAGMDLAAVAKYGCEKLGLKAPAGAEFVALDGYLTGAETVAKTQATVRHAQDAAPAGGSFVGKFLADADK